MQKIAKKVIDFFQKLFPKNPKMSHLEQFLPVKFTELYFHFIFNQRLAAYIFERIKNGILYSNSKIDTDIILGQMSGQICVMSGTSRP